jgi:hypothetical protein
VRLFTDLFENPVKHTLSPRITGLVSVDHAVMVGVESFKKAFCARNALGDIVARRGAIFVASAARERSRTGIATAPGATSKIATASLSVRKLAKRED